MSRANSPCVVEGCRNLRMLKDHRFGKPYYRTVCQQHWKRKHSTRVDGVCERCGWRGRVHQHREVPGAKGGAYVAANVTLLCPNDHGAVHGEGSWNQRQVDEEESGG